MNYGAILGFVWSRDTFIPLGVSVGYFFYIRWFLTLSSTPSDETRNAFAFINVKRLRRNNMAVADASQIAISPRLPWCFWKLSFHQHSEWGTSVAATQLCRRGRNAPRYNLGAVCLSDLMVCRQWLSVLKCSQLAANTTRTCTFISAYAKEGNR